VNASSAVLALLLSSSALSFAPGEHTRRPARIEPFWQGLDRAAEAAPASGIVALRAPLEGRVRITGGRFVMGSTTSEMQQAILLCNKEPFGDLCEDGRVEFAPGRQIRSEGHAHEVTLADYDIDRTEVTVARYARCVSVSACSPPTFPSGDPRYDRPDLPITHVRWDDAVAYCKWVGGRLPTEAEWEHAARGRAGHTFPWGELYNPRLANHGSFADDPTDARDGFVGLAPVGSFPDGATPTGILDMAGNAAEWVLDWFELDEEGFGYPRGAKVNPTGPVFGLGHVIRGGSYRSAAWSLRTAARSAALQPSREIGFRCAYDRKDATAPAAPTPAPSPAPAPAKP
jgi:formylglycine-generating enzyme required for sulfatase activity